MTRPNLHRWIGRAAVACLILTPAMADPTAEAQNLLKWCLQHPTACSISIDYANGAAKWHIDYNGTSLNQVASTIKIVHLIAYANAVDKLKIAPAEEVTLDKWGQFWIARDGGALASAYARLGHPSIVTNDQIVSAMIQDSDDAAPDYLLNKLGSDALADTIAFITGAGRGGYIDLPQSIGADFATFWGNPAAPNSGITALNNYSGYESGGYRALVDQIFTNMHNPAFVNAIRNYEGVVLPWSGQLPPAPGPFPLTENQYEQLTKGYSMRSNTRTYNQLMLGLLNRNLLSRDAQSVLEKFLEWRMASTAPAGPGLGPINTYFSRYGAKDGSFATVGGTTVRTRTIYAETKDDGTKVAVTIQLTGTPGTATDLGQQTNTPGSLDSAVRSFAFALATNPAFAAEVRNDLKSDPLTPSLIARVVKNTSTPGHVRLKVDITNIGTAPTTQQLPIDLSLAPDNIFPGPEMDRKTFGPLRPGETVQVDLDSDYPVVSFLKYFFLVIDHANVIPAVQKQNNPQFEKLP